jgi:hypothetical protein
MQDAPPVIIFREKKQMLEMEVIFMRVCEIPTAEMFSRAIHLHMGGKELTFEAAKRAAHERAKTYSSDPMLLSWFERKSGSYSPNGVECCTEGEPGWVAYARSRGADLTIDINDEDYIFMFTGQGGLT